MKTINVILVISFFAILSCTNSKKYTTKDLNGTWIRQIGNKKGREKLVFRNDTLLMLEYRTKGEMGFGKGFEEYKENCIRELDSFGLQNPYNKFTFIIIRDTIKFSFASAYLNKQQGDIRRVFRIISLSNDSLKLSIVDKYKDDDNENSEKVVVSGNVLYLKQ